MRTPFMQPKFLNANSIYLLNKKGGANGLHLY